MRPQPPRFPPAAETAEDEANGQKKLTGRRSRAAKEKRDARNVMGLTSGMPARTAMNAPLHRNTNSRGARIGIGCCLKLVW